VAIIELDNNGDSLLVWSFPGVSKEFEQVLLERSDLKNPDVPKFSFGKHKALWHYSTVFDVEDEMKGLDKVERIAIVCIDSTFNPEKFGALSSIFLEKYIARGLPTDILEDFLKCSTAGKLEGWDKSKFDDRQAFLKNCSMKALIKMFGIETIILWTGIILKKRIIVFAENWGDVFPVVRALPQFALHRRDWKIVRPQLQLTELQIADLTATGVYVAGCTDPAVRSRDDLYDIFVDVPGASISAAKSAQGDLKMGSAHKDLATKMLEASKMSKASDTQIVKMIAGKTKELIDGIKKIKGSAAKLTPKMLQAKGISGSMLRFLYNMASSEGL